MSRIVKKPIKIPAGVTVSEHDGQVTVEGSKGKLFLKLPLGVKVEISQEEVRVIPEQNTMDKGGTIRQLIDNMIKGVTDGWSKTLEIQGTGFRAQMAGDKLVMFLGFSHPVEITPPEGISFSVAEQQRKIIISGADKALVGETVAKIKAIKPPDAYKGKGIRFENEYIKLKPGKQVKVGAAVGGAK